MSLTPRPTLARPGVHELDCGHIGLVSHRAVVWATLIGLAYAVAIGLLTMRTELSANSDGAYLLSGAFHLAAGYGLIGFDGTPIAYWPPVYPALMAVVVAAGFDVRWGAWAVNALAVFGAMSSIAYLLLISTRSYASVVMGLAGCAVLHPMLGLFSDVHPDGLLLAFFMQSAIGAVNYLRGKRSGLVQGLIFASFAAMTKYQGLGLLAGWGLLILMRNHVVGTRITVQSMVALTLASAPLGAWILRNVLVTGSTTGDRSTTETMADYISQHLPTVIDTITAWFLPESMPYGARVGFVALSLLLLAIALTVMLRPLPAEASPRACGTALAILGGAYLAFTLVASVASMAFGVARYVAVVAPIVVLLVALAMDRLAARADRHVAVTVWALVAAFLLVVPSVRTVHLAARIQAGKPGYQYGNWYTEIRLALKSFPFDGVVLTNHGGLVWTVARVAERHIRLADWQAWLTVSPDVARERLIALMTAPSPITPPVDCTSSKSSDRATRLYTRQI